MNIKYSNKLVMYQSIIALLKDNENLITPVQPFNTSYTNFKNLVTSIEIKETERQTATRGKTQLKSATENDLIDLVISIAAGLYNYGKKNNLPEISEVADINYSYLERIKDFDLIIKAQQIHNAALSVKTEIVTYGVPETKISQLNAKREEFENAIGAREAAISNRVGVSLTIKELFSLADDILADEIDRYVEALGNTNGEFYEKYFNARKINDRGKRKEKTPAAPDTPIVKQS